jgi:hypothetical protein
MVARRACAQKAFQGWLGVTALWVGLALWFDVVRPSRCSACQRCRRSIGWTYIGGPFVNDRSGDRPAPKAGLVSGYVGSKRIVRSRQPFLDGPRALVARGYDALQHAACKFGQSILVTTPI